MDRKSLDVLIECRLREMLLEATAENDLRTAAAQDDWLSQSIHGPRYNTREWFGVADPTSCRRYLRAVERLASAGLLTAYRRLGHRLSNVKLTEAGLRFIAKL